MYNNGPRLDALRLDFVSQKPKSLWNMRAAELFAEYFLEQEEENNEDGDFAEEAVIGAFWVAFKNLKLNHKKEATNPQGLSLEQEAEQVLQRRSTNADVRRVSVRGTCNGILTLT